MQDNQQKKVEPKEGKYQFYFVTFPLKPDLKKHILLF